MYYSYIDIPTFCVPVQIIRTQQFLRHGGYYSRSQSHGPFYVNGYSRSYSDFTIGCRLQERPPKAA